VRGKLYSYEITKSIQSKSVATNQRVVHAQCSKRLRNAFQSRYCIRWIRRHALDQGIGLRYLSVSQNWPKIQMLQRHRLVNTILTDELKSGVHALSIVAKSPNQWKDEPVESSPNCRGGFGKWTSWVLEFGKKIYLLPSVMD
jgi:stress-induced morphogen